MVEIPKIEYSMKMLAFIDILGFEMLVNASKKDPEIIVRLHSILHRSEQMAKSFLEAKFNMLKVDQKEYRYRAFSDTVIICGPYDSHHDFLFVSMWIMMYQYLLWKEERIFIRGALTYGDLYIDENMIFGPTLIDSYHLERDSQKAQWPRIIVDNNLLDQCTEEEIKRDYCECLKKDDVGIVFLDYLREWFHQTVLHDNKRIIGERKEDLGPPDKFFMEHRNAILAQMQKANRLGNADEAEKIKAKYIALSRYHNETIQSLRNIIKNLLEDENIVNDYLEDQMATAEAERMGPEYKPKYNAENHPEQSDMLNILTVAINRLVEKPPSDIFEKKGIVIIGRSHAYEWQRVYQMFKCEMPRELSLLDEALKDSMISHNDLGSS